MTDERTDKVSVDELFLSVFHGMVQSSNLTLESALAEVYNASTGFLSKAAKDAVNDFQALYFSNANTEDQKNEIDREVDDLFERILAQVSAGRDVQSDDIKEEEDKKNARLALAASQKQLETVIRVEAGVREKLLPMLLSMKFAETTAKRLGDLSKLWTGMIDLLKDNEANLFAKMDPLCRNVLAHSPDLALYLERVCGENVDNLKAEEAPSLISSLI